MIVTFRIRRGTAAAWTAANPVMALGEPGLETDTRKVKYGDGVTAWNSLAYSAAASIAWTDITGKPAFPTGAIVGTSDTQTLTGKTISSASFNGVSQWTRTSGNPSLRGATDFVLDGDAGSGTLFLNAYCTGDIIAAFGGGTLVVLGKALRPPPKTGDPASPSPGDIYYNETTGKFRGYNGVTATWNDLN